MTDLAGFGGGRGWDDVADLDLSVGDNDAEHEPLDELSLLLPGCAGEPGADPFAEGVDVEPDASDRGSVVHLGLELPSLSGEGLASPLKVFAPASVFVQPDHAGEVDFGQSLDLSFDAGLATPEPIPPRLEFLGQPVPSMGPLEGTTDGLWFGQHPAQVVPDQRLHLVGQDEAAWTDHLPV